MADANPGAIERELSLIATMRLQDLKTFWSDRWGAPPQLRSVRLLRRLIAWRLQQHLFRGLDGHTRRLLQRETPLWGRPVVGTRLTREYRGVLHEVETLEHGFLYAGREYPNLTRLAAEITGTHWNGPRFFGLREPVRLR